MVLGFNMGSDFFKIKEVIPRKVRICAWCGEEIGKGSVALVYEGIYQGDFQKYYLHGECHAAGVNSPDPVDEFTVGEFKRGSLEQR